MKATIQEDLERNECSFLVGKETIWISKNEELMRILRDERLYVDKKKEDYWKVVVDLTKEDRGKEYVSLARLCQACYAGELTLEKLEDWLRSRDEKTVIDHLNGDRRNNTCWNLYKMENRTNCSKSSRVERTCRGRRNVLLVNDGENVRAQMVYATNRGNLHTVRYSCHNEQEILECVKYFQDNAVDIARKREGKALEENLSSFYTVMHWDDGIGMLNNARRIEENDTHGLANAIASLPSELFPPFATRNTEQ